MIKHWQVNSHCFFSLSAMKLPCKLPSWASRVHLRTLKPTDMSCPMRAMDFTSFRIVGRGACFRRGWGEVGVHKVQAYPREWGWLEGTSPKVFSPQKISFKTRDLELPFVFEGSLPSCSPHSAGYTRSFLHPYFPVTKFQKRVVRFFSHWKPQEPWKPREPRDEIVTLPALPKKIVNIFSCLPGNFVLKNGRDFGWFFFWSPFPTKRRPKNLRKFWGKFGAKFVAESGTKIRKIRETFILQLFWPKRKIKRATTTTATFTSGSSTCHT